MIGTLGYVMSELEDGKPLSQVVRAAKTLGYTEPGSGQCHLVIMADILFCLIDSQLLSFNSIIFK